MAKVANNYNDLVKGSLTRQKLQNNKGYAKSPEFSPALVLIIFRKKSVVTNLRLIRSLVRSITILFYDNYTDTNPITLPSSLARAGKKRRAS